MKKVVVVTGSPRRGGNSELMADALIEGARSAGHTVSKWVAAEMQLGGCQACETCFSTGKACSYDDDFNLLAADIQKADVIVWATPVYWYGFSSQLKAAVDKLFSFYVAQKCIGEKSTLLLTCAQQDDDSVFAGVRATYGDIIRELEWKDLGELAVCGVGAVGDVIKTTALHKAREMGYKL